MDKTVDESVDAESLGCDGFAESQILSKLGSAAQAARSLIGLHLSDLGLVPGQDRLLLLLERDGRSGVSAVADALNIRPSTVSKMTDRLCERGLIKRYHDADDGRRIFLELTEKGHRLCYDIRAARQVSEDELHRLLGGSEAIRIAKTMVVLSEALTKQLRRHR